MIRKLLALIILTTPLMGLAQVAENTINYNSFIPAQNSSYLSIEDALMRDQAFLNRSTPKRLFFHFSYSYVNKPWVMLSPDHSSQKTLVESMHILDLGTAYYFSETLSASYQIPVAYVNVHPEYGGTKDSHWGDSRVSLKWKIAGDEDTGVAIIPELWLPTGVKYEGDAEGSGLGNSSWGFGSRLAFEQAFESLSLSLNLGYFSFPNAESKNADSGAYPQIDGKTRLFAGIGSLFALSKNMSLNLEYTYYAPAKGINDFNPPGEFYGGLRYQMNKGTSVHFGGGTGKFGNVGANDPRLVFGVKFPLYPGENQKSKSPRDTPYNTIPDVEPDESLIIETTSSEYYEPPKQEPLPPMVTDSSPVPIVDLSDIRNTPPPEPSYEKKVVFTKKEIYILDEVEFDLNMSTLTRKGRLILDQVARVILQHQSDIPRLHVAGHTDHQGNDRINDPLSKARAATVVNYLINKGISPRILTSKGYGSHRPKYNHKKVPKRLWEKNRRVEFKILRG